jgi:hypothetical protein
MEDLFFQSFIEIEKWDAAKWKATAFILDPSGAKAPMIGIVFENIDAGRQIFSEWLRRIGKVDRFEELRIAIIEGEILGEDPGYSIQISSDPQHTLRRAAVEGKNIGADLIAVIGRVHRMNPEPNSPHLPRFKKEFQKHKEFALIPVSAKGEFGFEYAIRKTEIHLRKTSEINGDDVDSAVFPEHYFDRDNIKN